MKTALIAAGALAAATTAGLSEASAKDVNFGLTISGPHGYVHVGTPPTYYGPNHVYKVHKKKKKHWKKKHRRGYWGPYPVQGPRYYGHCASPHQIRARLRHQGWYGFRIRKTTPRFVFVTGHRYGAKYRLKVNRCTGHIARAKPIGGHQFGIYW